jgi:DNA processing protein
LSKGVLATEGGINSGSMITIDCAIEQNRDVFIVPGNIYSRQSMGCNAKLKQLQGAMVTDVNDILKEYNIPEFISDKPSAIQLDYVEQLICNELEKGELHFDELLNLTNLEVNNLNSLLTKMEIMGIIKKLPGNNYGL